jgi:hypothetical protein
MPTKTYDYRKTILKVVISAVEIIVAGLLALQFERPELLLLVPIFEGLKNYLKHRNN